MTDAGYESEEHYHYLDEKEQLSYIKPADKTLYVFQKFTRYRKESLTRITSKKAVK